MMENNKEITPLSQEFDFSKVPSWYVLCTNSECPLRANCLRYLAGTNAPDNMELARCVMPKTLKNGECRWFDQITVGVWAAGFSHLFDKVLKKDYTVMRLAITTYLHGTRIYYEYKRGERVLSPAEQQWIRDYVRSLGYDWEVEFDKYFEDYIYHQKA
jgi:hypothetical protein